MKWPIYSPLKTEVTKMFVILVGKITTLNRLIFTLYQKVYLLTRKKTLYVRARHGNIKRLLLQF